MEKLLLVKFIFLFISSRREQAKLDAQQPADTVSVHDSSFLDFLEYFLGMLGPW